MIGFGSAEFGFILFGRLFGGSSLVPRRLAAVAVVAGVFGIISIPAYFFGELVALVGFALPGVPPGPPADEGRR